MSTELKRFEWLVAGYLGGELTPTEREELWRLLQSSEQLRTRFTQELESHALLKVLCHRGPQAAAAQATLVTGPAQTSPHAAHGPGIHKPPQPRSRRQRRWTTSQSSWLGGLIAASVLLALCAYLLLQPRSSGPQQDVLAQLAAMNSQNQTGSPLVLRHGKPTPLTVGAALHSGDRLEARGTDLTIQYVAEHTTLEVKAGAKLGIENTAGAKRVRLDWGQLSATVAKQLAGKSMTFVTPNGQAAVLGTQLTLAVSANSTRLEVSEGTVRLTNPEQKFIDVESGKFAVASAAVELKAEPLVAQTTALAPPPPALVLRYDFEDGMTPDNLKDGEVVKGPERTGNRFCVTGIAKPDRTANKKEIWFEKKHVTLFTYSPGMTLSFDCWVSGSGTLTVGVWNQTQSSSMVVGVKDVPMCQWTRVTFSLDDAADEYTRAKVKSGDMFMNLAVANFSTKTNSIFVDNLQITRP